METLSLNVTGMSCTGCEQRIDAVLGRIDGVGKVAADHRRGTVSVEHDPDLVAVDVIERRLSDAGYELAGRVQQ